MILKARLMQIQKSLRWTLEKYLLLMFAMQYCQKNQMKAILNTLLLQIRMQKNSIQLKMSIFQWNRSSLLNCSNNMYKYYSLIALELYLNTHPHSRTYPTQGYSIYSGGSTNRSQHRSNTHDI